MQTAILPVDDHFYERKYVSTPLGSTDAFGLIPILHTITGMRGAAGGRLPVATKTAKN